MIEVNRKLYMDDEGFKIEYYDDLKKELSALLDILNLKMRYVLQ